MAPVLKLNKHNERKEIEFELKYLKSLSVKERFELETEEAAINDAVCPVWYS